MNIVLQLTYDPQCTQTIGGAFIRGNAPALWLREMDNWHIPLEGMVCLIIPEHSGSVTPAGLFVIFGQDIPAAEHITHAYTTIGTKLFIPVHASLHPLLSYDEMASLLIWEWQIFHPGIGFTGFNKEDELEPSELISFAQPVETRWDLAHPGMPPMARLREISVDKSAQEEVLHQLGKEIDTKPLSEINGKSKKPFRLPGVLDFIVKLLMMPVWCVLKIFSHIHELLYGNKHAFASLAKGWLQRFMDWMEGTKKSLQHSRNSELERLMHLFDEDMNEALRYAIPLNNPYAGRGTAAPSSTLGRHEANFNLGNLGGGGRTDYWNTDKYYESLSTKYYTAAQKAETAKDFKKAAYIYANLLGNFHAAAKALEKGQFFREAAVLYRDHMKKPLDAAECLEKGGLLLEAIDIYKEQNQYEKTGDTYLKLSQEEAAFKYYRKSVDVALLAHDYIKAAKILEQKLRQAELALATLLDGWLAGRKQEDCLDEYFNTVIRTDETLLSQHLRKVFEQHTAPEKQISFLSVLVMANNKTTDPAAKDTARELAYLILSKDASAGNTDKLSLLRHFIPDDQQLPSDYNRFKNREPEKEDDNIPLI
jgi:tetratricopeptide (TPR) repeat protein